MNDYDVRRAFERIELELIESMKRNLGRHLAEEEKEGFRWNMWQEEQLKSLKAYQRANREKFNKRFSRINEEIEDYIRKNADNAAIAEELRILRKTINPKATIEDLLDDMGRDDADFFRVNSPKLDELLKAIQKDMEKAEHAMLRKMNDQYRKIIFDSQVYANTGAGTLKQAVDMASRDFLRAGINCVEYKGGRLVNIASYAEMAIRTANQRAVLISEGNIRQQHGWHLVRISRYGGCSETCLPWQGRVYVDDVYSGGTKAEAKDTGYPLLSEAIAGGLFHPNCKHRATTFFQGMQNDHSADGEFENEPEQAKHNKYLREIQRQKRIAAGSLDEQNVRVAKNRQKQWEKKDDQITSKNSGLQKSLSEDEEGAVMKYIGPDSYLLNDKLRRGVRLSDIEKSWIRELDAALEKLSNYEGDVIRVVDFAFKEDREDFFDEFNIGFDKTFDQYISSSKKEGYNENAQVIIYIKSKTGKDISLYNPEENEVLFKRNAYFTCLDKKKENDHYYIWLEEEYDV